MGGFFACVVREEDVSICCLLMRVARVFSSTGYADGYGSHISWREEGGEGMATSFSRTGSELEMLCCDLGDGMEAQMFEPVGIGFGKPDFVWTVFDARVWWIVGGYRCDISWERH